MAAQQPGPVVSAMERPCGLNAKRRRARKWQLAQRDGQHCAYCFSPFRKVREATMDHVAPYSLLRTWSAGHLVLACRPCNTRKADRLPLSIALLLCQYTDRIGPVTELDTVDTANTRTAWGVHETVRSPYGHLTDRADGVRTTDPHTPYGPVVNAVSTVSGCMSTVSAGWMHPASTPAMSAHAMSTVSGPVNAVSGFTNTQDPAGADQRDDPRHTPRDDPRHTPSTDPTDRKVLRLVGSGGSRGDAPDSRPVSTPAPTTAALAVLRLLARLAHARLSTPDRGERSTPHQPIPLTSPPTDREVAA
ncbi:HNH endonuclease [Streptomyces scopuliridis]|uniref:HNH endonuclease n=1 Tax=Streptomyces scopuliridis TaxID=452529 RepID=UPI0036B19568